MSPYSIQSTLDISNSDNSNSAKHEASEPKIHFGCLLQPQFGAGHFFTIPNYPKVKLICTSGNLNLKKIFPTTSRYRELSVDRAMLSININWYTGTLLQGKIWSRRA